MSLFNFDEAELLTFFAVLVRYSVLFSILPFFGDKVVPQPVKILLSIAVSMSLFPSLMNRHLVNPADAIVWGSSAGGIALTIAVEALLALMMGYIAKLAFDTVTFGGNMVGTFMGFGMANTYDHNQQGQTQVVAEIQIALATLLFLVLDGHHYMLAASLRSYGIVGVGGKGILPSGGITPALLERVIQLTGQVIKFGIQIAAPVAVVLFGVNVAFGVMAKTLPQLNVLVLSVSVSALVGLTVMFLSLPEFQGAVSNLFSAMPESMEAVLRAVAQGR